MFEIRGRKNQEGSKPRKLVGELVEGLSTLSLQVTETQLNDLRPMEENGTESLSPHDHTGTFGFCQM